MADLQNSTTEARAAQVLPFKRPIRYSEDGVLYVPPPSCEGVVYIFFGKPRERMRKPRWYIVIQFCNSTHDLEEGPADWETAMFVARCRARKYGFRISDVSDTEYCGFAKSKGLRSPSRL